MTKIKSLIIKNHVLILGTFTVIIGVSSTYLYGISDTACKINSKDMENCIENTPIGTHKCNTELREEDFNKTIYESVKKHEGYSSKVYNDSLGKPTICIGHLIKPYESFPNGATAEQCEQLFKEDIALATTKAMSLEAYQNQPVHVQQFLIEFTFQVGVKGIDKFKRLLSAIKTKEYPEARLRLAKSLFARQMITANKGRLTFNQRASDYSDQLSWQGSDDFMGKDFYYEVTKTKVCQKAYKTKQVALYDDCKSAFE